MEKKELRKAMKRRNLALCPEARAEASARIFAQVEAMPAFAAARTVALFVSLDDEPDTREALERWRATRRVVVPRVEGETMRFFRYDPATMRSGAFGIPEPGPEAEPCDPAAIDLVAVPGTAFTASGSPVRPGARLLRPLSGSARHAGRADRHLLPASGGGGAARRGARCAHGRGGLGLNVRNDDRPRPVSRPAMRIMARDLLESDKKLRRPDFEEFKCSDATSHRVRWTAATIFRGDDRRNRSCPFWPHKFTQRSDIYK